MRNIWCNVYFKEYIWQKAFNSLPLTAEGLLDGCKQPPSFISLQCQKGEADVSLSNSKSEIDPLNIYMQPTASPEAAQDVFEPKAKYPTIALHNTKGNIVIDSLDPLNGTSKSATRDGPPNPALLGASHNPDSLKQMQPN